MKILTKQEYRKLSSKLLLGNVFPSWNSLEECDLAGYNSWLTVRANNPANTHLFVPCILRKELDKIDPNAYVQAIPPPNTVREYNLEIWREGQYMVHGESNPTLNLRHDLERNKVEYSGLLALTKARSILQEQMGTLDEIWEQYPTSVIECSLFKEQVGLMNSPLIIWEVRDY